jgi:outer membrane immunogenic protein
MKKIASAIACIAALIAAPAFAADMPVKAPPAAPAPVPTWTGWYGGIQFGGGWGDEAVTNSVNDPAIAFFFSAGNGNAPLLGAPRSRQSGAVGGVEAGYNWQAGLNWLLGIEADFRARRADLSIPLI